MASTSRCDHAVRHGRGSDEGQLKVLIIDTPHARWKAWMQTVDTPSLYFGGKDPL